MDGFIHSLLNEFEKGQMSRRKLIETLSVAAMTAYVAESIEGSELLAAPVPDRRRGRVDRRGGQLGERRSGDGNRSVVEREMVRDCTTFATISVGAAARTRPSGLAGVAVIGRSA